MALFGRHVGCGLEPCIVKPMLFPRGFAWSLGINLYRKMLAIKLLKHSSDEFLGLHIIIKQTGALIAAKHWQKNMPATQVPAGQE